MNWKDKIELGRRYIQQGCYENLIESEKWEACEDSCPFWLWCGEMTERGYSEPHQWEVK